MTWDTVASEIARVLSLPAVTTAEARAGLALVRATAELAHHLDEPHRAHGLLHRWLKRFDPEAQLAHVAHSSAAWPTREEPAWLAAYRDDEVACAALPPHVLQLGLLLCMAPGRAAVDPAWRYVDAAAAQLQVGTAWQENVLGWLWGSATLEVVDEVASQLDVLATSSEVAGQLVDDVRAVARELRAERVADTAFFALRNHFQAHLRRLAELVRDIGIERTPLQTFERQLEAERFRLVVLGEFKRGKSSLINALLDQPELLPVELLPCTAEIVALRYRATPTFESWDPTTYCYVPQTRADFYARAGRAMRSTDRRHDHPHAIPRWQLGVPANFLAAGVIELVDTPGINEDPLREQATRAEAHRADAVMIVLEPGHLASLQDLGLIETLRARIHNVFLVVNRADEVDEHRWTELRAHIQHRLVARGIELHDDRIVFVSSTSRGPRWTSKLAQLREQLQRYLVQSCSKRRLEALDAAWQTCAAELHERITKRLARNEHELRDINRLGHNDAELHALYQQAEREIKAAVPELADATQLSSLAVNAFERELPTLLARVEAASAGWASSHSPLLSPRKHVEDIARQGSQALHAELARWAEESCAPAIAEHCHRALRDIQPRLVALAKYGELTEGIAPDKLFETVQRRAVLEHSLADAVVGTAGASLRVGATGAASLLVGYVAADAILYYVLGAISGFLALPLLIAAVLAGSVIFVVMGRARAQAWIRTEVCAQLLKSMKAERSREQCRDALTRLAKTTMEELSVHVHRACVEVLTELRYQRECARKMLLAQQARVGTAEALSQERQRLIQCAAQLRMLLDVLGSYKAAPTNAVSSCEHQRTAAAV